MKKKNRRQFLKSSAASAAGTAVIQSVALKAMADPAPAAMIPTKLAQFEYADVQLLDGPMLDQFHQNV
jgi:hypothetical protein